MDAVGAKSVFLYTMFSSSVVVFVILGALWITAASIGSLRLLSRASCRSLRAEAAMLHLRSPRSRLRPIEAAGGGLVGTAVAVGPRRALVPWDLSTADARGYRLPNGGPDTAHTALAIIAVIGGVNSLVSALIAWFRNIEALSCMATGAIAWLWLFVWRFDAAHVVGANLWIAGFILFAIPIATAACVVITLIVAVQRRFELKRSRSASSANYSRRI